MHRTTRRSLGSSTCTPSRTCPRRCAGGVDLAQCHGLVFRRQRKQVHPLRNCCAELRPAWTFSTALATLEVMNSPYLPRCPESLDELAAKAAAAQWAIDIIARVHVSSLVEHRRRISRQSDQRRQRVTEAHSLIREQMVALQDLRSAPQPDHARIATVELRLLHWVGCRAMQTLIKAAA